MCACARVGVGVGVGLGVGSCFCLLFFLHFWIFGFLDFCFSLYFLGLSSFVCFSFSF